MSSDTRKNTIIDKNSNVAGETVLKVTKEIVIKFIEVGRITPTTFEENFKRIHSTITETVEKRRQCR